MITTTTTICPAQSCDQSVETDCIIYDNDHDCIGITSGMTVTEVMDIILDKLNLIDCTTTVPPACGCYLLINNTNNPTPVNINYIDCNNAAQVIQLNINQRKYLCCKTVSSTNPLIKIGTAFELSCITGNNTCTNRDIICYSLTASGDVGQAVNFQYIDNTGTLQTDGISVGAPFITKCAWKDSVDKTGGIGTLVITENGICDALGVCIP
jgi:hypothetical protein